MANFKAQDNRNAKRMMVSRMDASRLHLALNFLLSPLYTLFDGSLSTSGFPVGSDDKESACNAGDSGSIPGSGRSPGGGNGNPLQCPCLGNPMDRGDW